MLPTLIRRFVIMAVAVPLAAAGARKLSEVMEARRGPSRASGYLRQGADLLQGFRKQKKSRFPFRR
jgi:NADH:ubiquinone oxidoreductase subunit H